MDSFEYLNFMNFFASQYNITSKLGIVEGGREEVGVAEWEERR